MCVCIYMYNIIYIFYVGVAPKTHEIQQYNARFDIFNISHFVNEVTGTGCFGRMDTLFAFYFKKFNPVWPKTKLYF